jgi:hypothetical protein
MSDPLRIGLVAEGITDKLVIEAAIKSLLGERSFILRLLQPVESVAFGSVGSSLSQGKGWGGVYLWCEGVRQRNDNRLAGDILFWEHDILIVHLDADVAGKNYSDCEIQDPVGDLPCEEPCPPALATTDKLRAVLLRWLGESSVPPNTVLCTPSKSCETWVIAALFPKDIEMIKKGWECHPSPDSRLGTKPKAVRITKSNAGYQSIKDKMTEQWAPTKGRIVRSQEVFERFRFCSRHPMIYESEICLRFLSYLLLKNPENMWSYFLIEVNTPAMGRASVRRSRDPSLFAQRSLRFGPFVMN